MRVRLCARSGQDMARQMARGSTCACERAGVCACRLVRVREAGVAPLLRATDVSRTGLTPSAHRHTRARRQTHTYPHARARMNVRIHAAPGAMMSTHAHVGSCSEPPPGTSKSKTELRWYTSRRAGGSRAAVCACVWVCACAAARAAARARVCVCCVPSQHSRAAYLCACVCVHVRECECVRVSARARTCACCVRGCTRSCAPGCVDAP